MNIEQAVKDAIEEFGDRAYERFIDDKGFSFSHNDEILRELVGWCDIQLKPLLELFEHGVKFYGFEQEKQMWKFKGAGGDWQDMPDFVDYRGVLKGMTKKFYEHRRKNSASLPFDIDRAKAGDVVEIESNKSGYGWIKCKYLYEYTDKRIVAVIGDLPEIVERNKLRMKYPKVLK